MTQLPWSWSQFQENKICCQTQLVEGRVETTGGNTERHVRETEGRDARDVMGGRKGGGLMGLKPWRKKAAVPWIKAGIVYK